MGPDLLTLAIHRLNCLSAREKLLLREIIPDSRQFLTLSAADVARIIGRGVRSGTWKPVEAMSSAEHDAGILEKGEIRCISILEQGYPPQLAEIFDPPYLLFYRGSLPSNTRPALAIVGTRYPTSAGLDASFDVAFQAGDAGVPVVSGLALGIDTAAHQGTLHAGGYTVAVLGCGCDNLYPPSSAPVGRGILSAGGCVMSEFPPGTEPFPYNFPRRNRIISGLCRGVLVVQAPEKSGALITADFALEEGRDLFVCHGLLDSPANQGCRQLAASGAPGIGSMSDILTEWGVTVFRKEHYEKKAESVGEKLALLLEEEITGALVRHRGKIYRRMYQHG